MIYLQNQIISKLFGGAAEHRGDSPFVILAGERRINKLSDGACVANIIYNNNQRQFTSAFSVSLVCQVRKIQLQLLEKKKVNSN